jgi:hypothetical protein
MKRTIVLLAAGLAALMGCSPSSAYCQKKKDCCAQVGGDACTQMNLTGGVERCRIDFDDFKAKFTTYNYDACNKAVNALNEYGSCMAAISCSDISTTAEKNVSKCQSQAVAYCTALKATGTACGGDNSNRSCDNVIASF